MDRKEKGQGNMALYTFIMEYDGGTYISQDRLQCKGMKEVLISWSNNLRYDEIEWMDGEAKLEFLGEIESEVTDPVPLQGLENAWSTAVFVAGKTAEINIVETVPG